MEKKDVKELFERYPTQSSRIAGDKAVDLLLLKEPYATMNDCVKVWNDAYLSSGGVIKLKSSSKTGKPTI